MSRGASRCGIILLAAAVIAGAPLAAPAADPAPDRLRCALDLIPAEAALELAARYETDRSRADFDSVIGADTYERIGLACLDLDAADARERASSLGQAVMAWQLMHVSRSSLERRHQVSALALEQAWRALAPDERDQLAQGANATPIVVRMTAKVRPDLVRAADPASRNSPEADRLYLDLVEDVAVYGSSRALLEALEGRY